MQQSPPSPAPSIAIPRKQQAAGRQQWVAREQGSEAEESTWRSLASQAPPLDVPPHSPFHSPWSCLPPCAQITHSPAPSPPSPSYPPSPLFLPGQRKASSKRGEGSRREEAMGAPRAGSRAAAPASSTVEVVSIAPATTLHKGPTPPRFRSFPSSLTPTLHQRTPSACTTTPPTFS
ncbi:unnamed protein product [Closterium sp. Naga37s-1]|nr:unnamed protein product [Closterium sp. Naga37s-1]